MLYDLRDCLPQLALHVIADLDSSGQSERATHSIQ